MPKYDYKCQGCGYTEEVEHSINADTSMMALSSCWGETYGHCSGGMRKVFSATPAVFRGTGWGKD